MFFQLREQVKLSRDHVPSSEVRSVTPIEQIMSANTLIFVASYNSFSVLAHEPKGTPAKYSLSAFRFDPETSQMTLVAINDQVENLAFLRWSRDHNLLYGCSESIEKEDVGKFSIPMAVKKNVSFFFVNQKRFFFSFFVISFPFVLFLLLLTLFLIIFFSFS